MPWYVALLSKHSFSMTLIVAWRENDSLDYVMDDKTLIRSLFVGLSGCIWFSEKCSCISDSQAIASDIKILRFLFFNLISRNKAIFQGIEIFHNKEKCMLYYFFTKSFTYKWAPPLIPVYCLHSANICIFEQVFQITY